VHIACGNVGGASVPQARQWRGLLDQHRPSNLLCTTNAFAGKAMAEHLEQLPGLHEGQQQVMFYQLTQQTTKHVHSQSINCNQLMRRQDDGGEAGSAARLEAGQPVIGVAEST